MRTKTRNSNNRAFRSPPRMICAVFILLLFPLVFAQEYVTFNETFPDTAFSINKVNTCLNYPTTVIKNVSYTTNVVDAYNVTLNNEWYCWTGNTHTYTENLYRNESLRKNTDYGLEWNAGIAAGSNPTRGIFYPLGVTFDSSLSDSAYISLYCGYVNTNQYLLLQLLDDDGNFLHQFDLSGGSNTQCTISSINDYNCCDLPAAYHCPSGDTIGKVTINSSAFDYCNWTSSENIEAIGFRTSQTGGDPIYLDDVSVKLLNGSNQLPRFFINANQTYYCIEYNESFPYTVPLDVRSNDQEGDLMYYATGFSKINITKFKDFGKGYLETLSQGAGWTKTIDDLQSECGFTYYFSPEEDRHKFIETFDTVDDETWALNLNGDCINETKDVYHVFGETGKALSYEVEILDFNQGESLNITVLDEKLNKQDFNVKLMLNRSSENITINALYSNGTIEEVFNFNITNDNFRLFLSNTVGARNNYYLRVTYSETSYSLDTTQEKQITVPLNIDTVGGTVFEIKQASDIYLGYILFTLNRFNFQWSTTRPTEITFYHPHTRQFVFYITDSAHYPNEYREDYIWYTVEQKEYCDVPTAQLRDDIQGLAGDSFQGYFDYIDENEKAANFLWFLFPALTIFFAIMGFKRNGYLQVAVPVLFASVICLLFGILLSSADHIIAFNITGMLALTKLIMDSRN